jgi:hypothetical protein
MACPPAPAGRLHETNELKIHYLMKKTTKINIITQKQDNNQFEIII